MGGVTLKAPINEFSGGFFVTNSTDGELHDFWITEHSSEHRNVLMGQLPCNQPLCFKQWHSSLPVHNAWLCGVAERSVGTSANSLLLYGCFVYGSLNQFSRLGNNRSVVAATWLRFKYETKATAL